MLPVDEMFLRTMRGPIVFEVFASGDHGNVEHYPNLHVVDGSVTADRDQRVRRTLTCNIAIPEGETVPINVLGILVFRCGWVSWQESQTIWSHEECSRSTVWPASTED